MNASPHSVSASDSYDDARHHMVETQIVARGVKDEQVLRALQIVPRHLFVPPLQRSLAYRDHPLPIGYEQTISQPYIVALMTELLDLDGTETVLEVGTGSGYQAAVLAEIGCTVYSIEIVPELAVRASEALVEQGYTKVTTRIGDGYSGWEEVSPFDRIMITAAAPHIPQPLIEQLRVGGKMVIPVNVGASHQILQVIEKKQDGTIKKNNTIPVRFVPLVRSGE